MLENYQVNAYSIEDFSQMQWKLREELEVNFILLTICFCHTQREVNILVETPFLISSLFALIATTGRGRSHFAKRKF